MTPAAALQAACTAQADLDSRYLTRYGMPLIASRSRLTTVEEARLRHDLHVAQVLLLDRGIVHPRPMVTVDWTTWGVVA